VIRKALHDRAGFPCEAKLCTHAATAVVYLDEDEESFIGRFCDDHKNRRFHA